MTTTTSNKPAPELPHGVTTTLGGLSETFAFHSSPESFIASRVSVLQRQRPDLFNKRAIVRAKILNRDVAVVSSHAHIRHILDQPEDEYYSAQNGKAKPTFVAAEAYSQFMGPFYPSPNLLMMDGADDRDFRHSWREKVRSVSPGGFAAEIAKEHFNNILGREVSIYSELKKLCWKVLLGTFLKLEETDPEYAEMKSLQEDVLHGQFSLFPVSVNVGFWHSPRKRGINAKEKLRKIIFERIGSQERCPFHHGDEEAVMGDYANHLLMFTSSLAVKGLASLLTAYLLNIFLFRSGEGTLHEEILGLQGDERLRLLRSIKKETQRLSPPIVGIMRRVTEDTVIPSSSEAPDTLLPRGWDVWLYFVGGGRDPQVFGEDWAKFVPGRYLDGNVSKEGFAFSTGPKQCLGKGFIEEVAVATAAALLDAGVCMEGEVDAKGVRGWLGWEEVEGLSDWERDVKQLPTQHPAKPILVRVAEKK